MLTEHLSFRTRIFLVFLLCLFLLGTATVFLNAYLISGLEARMRQQARHLAEDQARNAANEIAEILKKNNIELSSQALTENTSIGRQIEIVLQGNENIMAVCLLDAQGRILSTGVDKKSKAFSILESESGTVVDVDPSDLKSLRVAIRKTKPHLQPMEREFSIGQGPNIAGRMRFLFTDSSMLRDLQATGSEITRRLWSVTLAFVGVLAMGLYMVTRMARREVTLMEENEKLDRMAYVGTLASGLAHEIRNPLNAMSISLQVAQEDMENIGDGYSPLASQALARIEREMQRLNQSVTSFLAFARPESSRQQETDLREILDEVLELLNPAIEEGGIALQIELDEENTMLKADFSGLRQVLYNVMLNAIQALASPQGPTRKHRRLRVGGRRESAQWRLWVEDNGPGILPGMEERIFEAFHTTKAGGSGFGLSIAKAVVDSHDGDITAHSLDTGGTRVEIILPETARLRTNPFSEES